ncbi:MAG TPA: cyclic nucleotide-binding domain-containing protein [Thermoanaerobaculia bacterium]|jgi:CRP-like cAMP-binding protein/cytochrome c-type biogenesis protein CcmH/NrfG
MSDPQGSSQDLDELAALARRFAEREMFEEAAELYQVALRVDPKNLGVKLGLAEVRRLQRLKGGRPASLKEGMREQFRRNAIDAAHFLGLAHLYAEKGEHGRASECLEVAKAKDLADPSHFKLQGRILFRRQDFDGAAEEFGKALRYNPFDREIAESLGRAEYERKQFEAAIAAAVHAFLLVNEADSEAVERIRRRIQTLKQILGWGSRELARAFRQQQDELHTAFDRLEWHRERFLEEGGMPGGALFAGAPPKITGGQIELAIRLRRLRLWSHLSDEQIFKLTKSVSEEDYDAGSVVFTHRSAGPDIYVLERGEITIQRPTSYGTFTLGTIEPGDVFGEASFITRQERSGDAVATQPCHLLRIDAKVLEQLIADSPDLGTQLYWSFWHGLARKLRGTNEQLKSFFSSDAVPENFLRLRRQPAGASGAVKVESSDKIRLFREQGLSRRELMTLATFSKEKKFTEGAYLFQEGDRGAEMYVVLEGRAMISKFIPGAGEEALAILERGDFFGEMSLVDGEPRSADAKAYAGPLTVLALDQATVKEVLAMDPHASLEFLQLLCRLIANRLREIDEKVVGWRILSGERSAGASA